MPGGFDRRDFLTLVGAGIGIGGLSAADRDGPVDLPFEIDGGRAHPGGEIYVEFQILNPREEPSVEPELRFGPPMAGWSKRFVHDDGGQRLFSRTETPYFSGWRWPGLESGESVTPSFVLKVPADATPGSYSLPALVLDEETRRLRPRQEETPTPGPATQEDQPTTPTATADVQTSPAPTPTSTARSTPTRTATPARTTTSPPTAPETSSETPTEASPGTAATGPTESTVTETPELQPTTSSDEDAPVEFLDCSTVRVEGEFEGVFMDVGYLLGPYIDATDYVWGSQVAPVSGTTTIDVTTHPNTEFPPEYVPYVIYVQLAEDTEIDPTTTSSEIDHSVENPIPSGQCLAGVDPAIRIDIAGDEVEPDSVADVELSVTNQEDVRMAPILTIEVPDELPIVDHRDEEGTWQPRLASDEELDGWHWYAGIDPGETIRPSIRLRVPADVDPGEYEIVGRHRAFVDHVFETVSATVTVTDGTDGPTPEPAGGDGEGDVTVEPPPEPTQELPYAVSVQPLAASGQHAFFELSMTNSGAPASDFNVAGPVVVSTSRMNAQIARVLPVPTEDADRSFWSDVVGTVLVAAADEATPVPAGAAIEIMDAIVEYNHRQNTSGVQTVELFGDEGRPLNEQIDGRTVTYLFELTATADTSPDDDPQIGPPPGLDHWGTMRGNLQVGQQYQPADAPPSGTVRFAPVLFGFPTEEW